MKTMQPCRNGDLAHLDERARTGQTVWVPQRWNSAREVAGKARLKIIVVVGGAVLALLLVGLVPVKGTVVGKIRLVGGRGMNEPVAGTASAHGLFTTRGEATAAHGFTLHLPLWWYHLDGRSPMYLSGSYMCAESAVLVLPWTTRTVDIACNVR
jgi:hypothetical protein